MLSLSTSEPTLLTRVTTQYDLEQDRIRLTGETSQGKVQEIWLTQRLLNRVLPGLWQWLQALPTVGVAADQRAARSIADPQRQQALQEFAQQQASASLPEQAPVVADTMSLPWLVRSAQLQSSSNTAVLRLYSAAEVEKAQQPGNFSTSISMNPMQLRQWLGIVLNEYRRAEWSIDNWPQWMQAPTAPSETAQLH